MKHKSVISYCSLFAAIVAVAPASGAVRVNNISRSNARAYNQVNELRMGTVGGNAGANSAQNQSVTNATPMISAGAGTTTGIDSTGAVVDLPVRVANADLAKKIAMGQTVGRANMDTLDACARIYPDGEFAWDTPTAGAGRGGAQTCVAVVHMFTENNLGEKVLLATANIAADDAIRCNIDDFPEYGWNESALETFEFPADHEPTMEDVVAQMNQEQKQNAGLKIAAGAVIGALGGNVVGKSERGSDSIMGTNKEKIQSSAIGALTGAAVMAGNSYAGKVGGDVILYTGVNAAAGGAIGNMMASGNTVLRIEKCESLGTSCLWGAIRPSKAFELGEINGATITAYYNRVSHDTIVCKTKEKDLKDGAVANNCSKQYLLNVRLQDVTDKSIEQLEKEDWRSVIEKNPTKFAYDQKTSTMKETGGGDEFYYKISSASVENGTPIRAMIPGVSDKAFGFTHDDWLKWKETHKNPEIHSRDFKGESAGKLGNEYKLEDFYPVTIDAEDGGLIDINNKARLKSTLTGAGVGGALGGFVGYQGAQSDINERWVSEVRNYNDSLTRVYCITGKRYLGKYNDTIKLPPLNFPDAE